MSTAPIDNSEMLELILKARGGCICSKKRIILSYTNTMHSFANKQPQAGILDTEDYFQICVEAIDKAIYAFDLKADTKFTTYLYATIKNVLIRHKDIYGKTIRMTIANITSINNIRTGMERDNSVTPTAQDMIEFVRTGDYRKYLPDSMSVAKETLIAAIDCSCSSSDITIDESGHLLISAIPDIDTTDKTDALQCRELLHDIDDFLRKTLNDRQYEMCHACLIIGEPVSVVAKRFGLSRSRVSWIVRRSRLEIEREFRSAYAEL